MPEKGNLARQLDHSVEDQGSLLSLQFHNEISFGTLVAARLQIHNYKDKKCLQVINKSINKVINRIMDGGYSPMKSSFFNGPIIKKNPSAVTIFNNSLCNDPLPRHYY